MNPAKDYQVFFDKDKISQNANLNGYLVYHVWQLKQLINYVLAEGEMIGIPEEELVRLTNIVSDYLELSRSEAMKGSEQLVRSFMGPQVAEPGLGAAPNLTPRAVSQNGTTLVPVVVDASKALHGDFAPKKRKRWGLR